MATALHIIDAGGQSWKDEAIKLLQSAGFCVTEDPRLAKVILFVVPDNRMVKREFDSRIDAHGLAWKTFVLTTNPPYWVDVFREAGVEGMYNLPDIVKGDEDQVGLFWQIIEICLN